MVKIKTLDDYKQANKQYCKTYCNKKKDTVEKMKEELNNLKQENNNLKINL